MARTKHYRGDTEVFLKDSDENLQKLGRGTGTFARYADEQLRVEVAEIISETRIPLPPSYSFTGSQREELEEAREQAIERAYGEAQGVWGMANTEVSPPSPYGGDELLSESNAAYIQENFENTIVYEGTYWIVFPLFDADDEGEPSSQASAALEVIEAYQNYPVLDEDDYSRRESEATDENVEEIARRVGLRDELPENWLGSLFRWFYEHPDSHFQNALESRDGGGGYPDEEDVRQGLHELGFLDPDEEKTHFGGDTDEYAFTSGKVRVIVKLLNGEDGSWSGRFSATLTVATKGTRKTLTQTWNVPETVAPELLTRKKYNIETRKDEPAVDLAQVPFRLAAEIVNAAAEPVRYRYGLGQQRGDDLEVLAYVVQESADISSRGVMVCGEDGDCEEIQAWNDHTFKQQLRFEGFKENPGLRSAKSARGRRTF